MEEEERKCGQPPTKDAITDGIRWWLEDFGEDDGWRWAFGDGGRFFGGQKRVDGGGYENEDS